MNKFPRRWDHCDFVGADHEEQIYEYLRDNYCLGGRSKITESHLIKFSNAVTYGATEISDGDLGSVLLNELRYKLPISCRYDKELIKYTILLCLKRLRAPIFHSHPKYIVSIEPLNRRSHSADAINRLSFQCLRGLPLVIVNHINSFAQSEFWWGRNRAIQLPPASSNFLTFSVALVKGDVFQLFQDIVQFPCTCLKFSNFPSAYVEWACDLSLLWIRAANCDQIIRLLRFKRRQAGLRSSRLLNVAGHGEAFL